MRHKMSRRKKLLLTIGMSLINQVITGISGLILPVYIMQSFGSAANGLVSSITQFLSIIAFMDMGVGAVVQSNLYKPLAQNDKYTISKMVVSAEKFYRKIAMLFLVYVVILTIVYPFSPSNKFDYLYTSSMVLILSIGTFAQYYFGITYQTLLGADQKSYIYFSLQTIAVAVNLLLCICFIKLGFGIHFVRLTTTIVYFVRPIGMNIYVRKNYDIDKKIMYEGEPIRQKWNGLAQHIAAVVLKNTDIIILTIFATLESVSVYTVYYNVMRILEQMVESLSGGFQSLIGNLYAKKETSRLLNLFSLLEWGMHSLITLLFTIAGVLIVPFVRVYTRNIHDVNYIYYGFGVVLSVACAMYCIRIPYNMIVKSAGHYKETQNSAIIEVIINLLISVIVVKEYGLIGVAFGTFVAMFYRTTYLAYYSLKKILRISIKQFYFNWVKDLVLIFAIVGATSFMNLNAASYLEWFIRAFIVGIVSLILFAIISCVGSRKQLSLLKDFLTRRK